MTAIVLVTVGFPTAAAVLIGIAVWRSIKAKLATEREFRNVFAMMSKERQEALITGWMNRKGCTRPEAMRHAIEERRCMR